MKTVIIVQARMTSTRLPGKVLKTVLGKPLLEYQLERLSRVSKADEIVIATTTNETDQPIVELCNRLEVKYFRGSEDDVLSRYYYAAKKYCADVIVRVTSDCPLIDPEVIDNVITTYLENQQAYDYVSNCLERTYPRGMDTEVFSFHVLKDAFEKAKDKSEREHVTSYIYRHPEMYTLQNIARSTDLSEYRLTVDTPEDLLLISNLLKEIYPSKPQYKLSDILNQMELHPDWQLINRHVEQKKYGE